MLFEVDHQGTNAVGAGQAFGQIPSIISGRWTSQAGSNSLGGFVANMLAAQCLFDATGSPSDVYAGFAAVDAGSGGNSIPRPCGLYVYAQTGTTQGIGVWIRPGSDVGIKLEGDATNITFGADDDASIVYDGTNFVYSSRDVGIGNHSFTGGSIQAVDGSGAECAYGFNNNAGMGMFASSTTSLNLAVNATTGLNLLETTSTTYVNAGLGATASLNDSYPLQVTRTQNAATYVNAANNSTGASARTAFLASNGIYDTQFGVFGTGPSTTPAYDRSSYIECGTSVLGHSFITKVAGQHFDFYLGSRTASGLNVRVDDDGLTTYKGVTRATQTITAVSDTLVASDHIIFIDASSNAVTINLPAAASHTGREYELICTDSTNTVTIDANGSETISGDLTITLVQYESIIIISDGTNWWVK